MTTYYIGWGWGLGVKPRKTLLVPWSFKDLLTKIAKCQTIVVMMNDKVIEWSATVVTILGAIATAAGYDPLNIYLLNLGSVLWLIWAVRIKKMSLVLVNAGLLIVYVFGLIARV